MMLILACGTAFGQKRTSQNYPVLVNPTLTTVEKEDINANQLYKGQSLLFSFSVFNPSQSESIKAGSCLLHIELGEKLKPSQKGTIKMPPSQYLQWTVVTDENEKTYATGRLKADLPADFIETVLMELQCSETGSSVIKSQWTDAGNTKYGMLTTLDFTVKKNKPKD